MVYFPLVFLDSLNESMKMQNIRSCLENEIPFAMLTKHSPNRMKTPATKNFALRSVLPLLLTCCITMITGCSPQEDGDQEGSYQSIRPELWTQIEEPSLGFKSRFPAPWKTRTQNMPTDQGMATVHIFEYWHVAFQYGITVVRFPPGVADMSEPDIVLDFAVNSLAAEHQGLVSFQENQQIGGYPARRAMISLPESYLKQARVNTLIVLRNELVYRVSTSGIGNHEQIELFLRSFELTPVMQ
jgi:hypothetical protein